jgi:hypothetical protein
MVDRKFFVGLDEVQRQAVVEIDGRERTEAMFRPRNAEDLGQAFCRRALFRAGTMK